jgi:diaminohydroxyphosphoribosylaminopyrimidine deaminase/5-amino-6-(5-phosphoribosylamino)uracil reductase
LIHGPDAAKEARVAWENAGAQLFGAGLNAEGHVAADDIMQALAKAGLTRVLCEGGGGLAASLLAADAVDEIITYQAGHVFGGDGLAAVQPYGVTALGAAPFTLAEVRQIGPDQRTRWMRQTQTVPPH